MQIMKLVIAQFSPSSCHSLSLVYMLSCAVEFVNENHILIKLEMEQRTRRGSDSTFSKTNEPMY
jgi:hypothetical protein